MNTATLSRGGVELVPYTSRFDAQTVAWLNDPAVYEAFGLTRSVTLEGHRLWLAAQKDLLLWAILDKKGVHQGNVSLLLTPRHASAYFQIYIGNPDARGKGMGWDALSCVLDHAFGPLKLHRVWLHEDKANAAAARLYQKAGFVEEGMEREAVLRKGVFHSQLRLSLLAQEWRPSTRI